MNSQSIEPYLLIAPLLVLLLVFILYPVVANIYLSFFKWKGMGKATFIGLENYRTMFSDETFWVSIKNTMVLLLYIPLGVMLPVLISAVLREGLKGWSLFRAIIYLPNILGYVIMGMISSILFRKLGPINHVLTAMGLESLALDWLSIPILALNTLERSMASGFVWDSDASSSCCDERHSASLYDAAKIDGAQWWRTFWSHHSSIRFSIEFWIVLSFIEILARAFSFIYSYSAVVGFATFTLEYGIYNEGFVAFNMGYASTWASVLFVVCAVIAYFQIVLMRKNSDVQ